MEKIKEEGIKKIKEEKVNQVEKDQKADDSSN